MDKPKIKILFVIRYYSEVANSWCGYKILQEFSNREGVEEIVALIPRKIKRHSHEDVFYTFYGKRHVFPNKKGVIEPVTYFCNQYINFLEVLFHIIKFRPDAIIVLADGLSKDIFITSIANFAASVLRLKWPAPKVYFYKLESVHKYLRFPIAWKIAAWLIKRLVHYGGVCTDAAKEALDAANWHPKVKKVWLGVPTEHFSRDVPEEEMRALKRHLGIGEDKIVIGFIGTMIEQAGVRDLVFALGHLNKERANGAVLLMISKYGDEHKEGAKMMKELAKTENVIILPRPEEKLPRGEELLPYYKIMDVFVRPSKTVADWKEHFGKVLVEAMAAGTKVVGSDCGSIPEVIDGYGTIFPEGNVEELKKAIEKELGIQRNKDELRERAEFFSIKNFIDRWLEFILENRI